MKNHQPRFWDWQIAVLFVGMLAVAAGRLVMTRWTESLILAQGAAVLGAILGLSLGVSQFRQRVRNGLAFEYTLVIIPWLLLNMVGGKEGLATQLASLFGRLSYGMGQLVRAEEVNDPIMFVAATSLIFWLVGIYSGQAIIQTEKTLAGLIPPSMLLLLIQYYDGFPSGRIWIVAVYFGLLLLLVGRIYYLQNVRLWQEKNIFTGPEPEFDLNRSIIVSTLVIVALAWMLPTPASALPAAARWWRENSEPFRNAQERIDKALAALSSRKPVMAERYGSLMALGNRADQGEGILFRVKTPALSLPRYYWRARVYDTYTNGQWEATQTLARSFSPAEDNLATPVLDGRVVEFEFEWLFASQSTLMLHSQPLWASRPADLIYTIHDAADVDVNGMRATPVLLPGERYIVRSFVRTPSVLELSQAGEEYPEWVRARYLTLPDNLPARISALAQEITAEAQTPHEKAERITQYLRQNITYSISVPSTPPGADTLDRFLFTWQSGYCTYYATAEVMLLRSVGVPARLAVGYAQGERSNGQYVVRAKDAHAWPEVYFPGIGWVEFEPTANQPALVYPSGLERDDDPGRQPLPNRLEPDGEIPEFNDDPDPFPDTEPGATNRIIIEYQMVLRWIIITSGIALVAYWIVRLHKRLPVPKRFMLFMFLFYRWRGIAIPNWLEHWQRWSELSEVERAFHTINQSINWLKQAQPESITPAERVKLLKKLLPDAAADIDILAYEHEMTLYSSTPGDPLRARQSAWKIRFYTLRHLFDRLFSGAPA